MHKGSSSNLSSGQDHRCPVARSSQIVLLLVASRASPFYTMTSIHLWKAKMKIHFTSRNNIPFLNGIAILLMLGLVGTSSLLIAFPAFGQDSLAKADPIRDEFSKFCNLYYTGDTIGKVTACANQSMFFSSFLSSLTDKTSLSLWPAKASLSDLAFQGKLKNTRGSITAEGAFF